MIQSHRSFVPPFQNFERKFAACLSSSAVRTKFAQHTTRGRAVVGAVAEIMAEVNAESVALQRELGTQKKELWDRCDFTEKQLELMTLEMKEKIHLITEDVEYKVSAAPRLLEIHMTLICSIR